jgi:hypothetical protein
LDYETIKIDLRPVIGPNNQAVLAGKWLKSRLKGQNPGRSSQYSGSYWSKQVYALILWY